MNISPKFIHSTLIFLHHNLPQLVRMIYDYERMKMENSRFCWVWTEKIEIHQIFQVKRKYWKVRVLCL